uniref:ribonuclease III n=1 Tax=uncultured prokaryote TaxID=198431 RepID=H5SM10_9ZZZZ|nr:ribonuclease III [uncultured prokaryote]
MSISSHPIDPLDWSHQVGLTFRDWSLLLRALTHRSYCNEHPEVTEDNERLEFLGDAVLDFIVGEWVYHHYPELREGELTRLRSALVRNEQLASFARQIDLGAALRLGAGEAASGARQRTSLLGSAFEALIGALYLDAGLETASRFVRPFLEKTVAALEWTHLLDPKSRLQEWAQAQRLGTPRYVTIAAHGPEHAPLFEVEVYIGDRAYGRGAGPNKQIAALKAAQDALQKIEMGEEPQL